MSVCYQILEMRILLQVGGPNQLEGNVLQTRRRSGVQSAESQTGSALLHFREWPKNTESVVLTLGE